MKKSQLAQDYERKYNYSTIEIESIKRCGLRIVCAKKLDRVPIIQVPMVGGANTAELVAAVSDIIG